MKTGMVIGVGSGTTVVFAAERIGELVNKHGFNITACPSSFQASQLLTKYNIPESDLSRHPKLDVVIDGADQFAEATLDLFKGGGGALGGHVLLLTLLPLLLGPLSLLPRPQAVQTMGSRASRMDFPTVTKPGHLVMAVYALASPPMHLALSTSACRT